MTPKQIAVYGGGGFAREVAWLVQSCNRDGDRYRVVCFIDDDTELHGTKLNGIPVVGLQEAYLQFPLANVVGGIGSPATREKTILKAAELGFEFEMVIHPSVERSEWVEFGEGAVICAGTILTTNIVLGRHVQINLDCTIGHDVQMDDFATLAPGVHVSGCVHIGKRAYVGTGAVIINGTQDAPLIIEDDAIIGAGACVTKHVPAGLTVVGVPAKPLLRG
ncbi:acetyltransferase [Aggregatilinea lenta]|uniref:acetyltransferase n=1 Tax=Aggregatilinea lenta TaxID=913108 RepID=UPI000E5A7112|nr:acetyltransferase [Aggregatilinea lenta]